MRFLLFLVVFAIGVLLMAPLDQWVLPRLRGTIAAAGAELRVGSLHFALPAGIRATGVGLDLPGGGIDVDSIYFGITRHFRVDGCGGNIRGQVSRSSLAFDLDDVDPAKCLRVGKLELDSPFDGSVAIEGFDLARLFAQTTATAKLALTSQGGVFRGILEGANADGSDLPLGEWEFSDLVLKASFAGGDIAVEEGHAMTSGVEWQLVGAHVPSPGSADKLRIDLRARQVEDDPRSRALIGLMPKAPADRNGWHNYRVTGSLASPRLIGVDQ